MFHSRTAFAAGLLASASLFAHAAAKPDQSFVDKAARGGMTEVALSRLAADKAADARVKDFAAHMVKDHTKAGDELEEVASGKGYAVPSALDTEGRHAKDKLAGLSGAAFDQAYMAQMLADHKKTVALFETEARGGKDAGLKAFAEKTLPTLKDHLKMAQETAAGVKTASR